MVLLLFVLPYTEKIKHIEDNIFLGRFIILTLIYQLDVIFIINSYYLSGKKFKEYKINCIYGNKKSQNKKLKLLLSS